MALTVALAMGCESLDVPNTNDPDAARALASGGDIRSLVGGAFSSWYYSMQNYGPSMTVATMADHLTASWGNWGMRTYSGEPRVALNNSATERSDILQVFEGPWYGNYGALVSANLAIKAIEGGVEIDEDDPSQTNMVLAASTFLQGATMANISLFFDKGFVVDETTDPATLTFSTRAEVRDAALAKLDAAITLANASTFELPDNYLNITGWTNTQLAQVANTVAARTIAYHARTAAENTAASWASVLTYASRGISSGTGFDPSITGDGFVNWVDPYKAANDWVTWARVDMRVVCKMDPTQPCRHPLNRTQIGPPISADLRMSGSDGDGVADSILTTTSADFIWRPASEIPHNPARGLYHFSEVGYIRYYYTAFDNITQGQGVLPFLLQAENDLLWAEALIRTGGSKTLAAAKINNSRVTRGGLTALTGAESDATLLSAIWYERDIELMNSSAVTPYYDMRRRDSLQTFTARQFPVPARELLVLQEEIYTFGGASLPDMSVAAGPRHWPEGIFGEVGGRQIAGPGEVLRRANEFKAQTLRPFRARRQ